MAAVATKFVVLRPVFGTCYTITMSVVPAVCVRR